MERLYNYSEKLQLREMDADYTLGLIEFYHWSRLPVSIVDVINYTYNKAKQGVCRLRIKELFIQDELQEKVDKILTEDYNNANKDGELNE
jgi:hypothetical protein